MGKVMMNNPANGKFAIFDEAPGGGNVQDPTALRHRPLNDPMAWLSSIYFHSDFNYYGVVAKDMARVISHPAVAGVAADMAESGLIVQGKSEVNTHVLITHGLGYVPLFFVAYAGQMIPHGTPIQQDDANRVRLVSAYATATQILLRDVGFSTDVALSAASRTYQVLVFRRVAADPALPLVELSAADVILGKGKFRLAQAHLRQVAPGESPFALAQGVCAAVSGGGLRVITPNGTAIDLGSYNGSLTAPPTINVGI